MKTKRIHRKEAWCVHGCVRVHLSDLTLAFLIPHQLGSGSSSLQGFQSSACPLPRGQAPHVASGGRAEPQRGEQLSERIPRAREAGCSPRSVRLQEGGPRGRRAAPGPGGDGDAGIVTVTRNGVAAEGSMLGLFSERLPGRLRREPGLSWGDSANRERERERGG